jgi:hypothetical protein
MTDEELSMTYLSECPHPDIGADSSKGKGLMEQDKKREKMSIDESIYVIWMTVVAGKL